MLKQASYGPGYAATMMYVMAVCGAVSAVIPVGIVGVGLLASAKKKAHYGWSIAGIVVGGVVSLLAINGFAAYGMAAVEGAPPLGEMRPALALGFVTAGVGLALLAYSSVQVHIELQKRKGKKRLVNASTELIAGGVVW